MKWRKLYVRPFPPLDTRDFGGICYEFEHVDWTNYSIWRGYRTRMDCHSIYRNKFWVVRASYFISENMDSPTAHRYFCSKMCAEKFCRDNQITMFAESCDYFDDFIQ